MEYPFAMIMQFLADFLLVSSRVSGMFLTMAGIGGKSIPSRVKTALAVTFSLMLIPVLPPSGFTELFSFQMILVVAQQLLIGIVIGFISQLFLNAFILAGQILAMQTGLGFASIVDPINGLNVPAVGQFYLILGTLIFWAIDGHLTMFLMLVHSFELLPISTEWWSVVNYTKVIAWGTYVFLTAASLALAPVTAMLLIQFAFGVMTRAAPQLNIFSLGFPITMTTGLMIIWLTLGNFMYHFEIHWDRAVVLMCDIAKC
ncbi:flagellar biosynthetic protein FliR [Algicola sagamiensis]|uniref:flagellar biosynthetic protein FliR n=1 Tax=Algicola sagamiensis TaxID=163869 RepID=UPI00047555B8|nr:flagellar biosynthetic protein FliR [Algicola sagamiensis]